MTTCELSDLEDKVDELRSKLDTIRQTQLVIAQKLGLLPFSLGDTVNPILKSRHWSAYDEIVVDFNADLTEFRSKYGNWFKVADFEKQA